MSIINEPIRTLLKTENIIKETRRDAFKAGKDILSKESVLTLFDVKKTTKNPVCVCVDASKCGLGLVLI